VYLNRIDQLRTIEWGKEYLWDIQFPSAPSPFNNWFPASNVEFPTATLKSKTFTGALSEYSIPIGTGEHKITITFLDDINHTLLDWLTAWINTTVVNIEGHAYVKTLDEAKNKVFIARLGNDRNALSVGGVAYIEGFWVYPEGSPVFKGGSDSKPFTYSQDFVIIGELNSRPYIDNMLSKGFLKRE
jgi:hypothetical protein